MPKSTTATLPMEKEQPRDPGVKEVALVPADQAQPPVSRESHLALVIERLAANPDVDVAKIEKIIELQERMMRLEAEAAFNVDFAAMQAKLPTVSERAHTDKTSYAPLEDIIEAVRPVLCEFGFSVSHRTEWPNEKTVKVVGILTHRAGHARQSEFLSAADQTGSKNAIQALGSSVQYGRRYTTKDLLNIVTRGEDDDGEKAGKKEAPKAPAGYEDWYTDLTATADNGTKALEQMWAKSKGEFKTHLVKHNNPNWNALKAKAARVAAS